MPRVGRIPEGEKALAAEIRDMNKGALVLNLTQVGRVLGISNRYSILAWLSTLVPRDRNGVSVWLVSDVAHKLYQGEAGMVG